MLYEDALIVDYGPEFLGQAMKVNDGIVCVVPDHLHPADAASAAMREMVGELAGDCGDCRRCPAGQLG
jgi:hypothetical protein